MARTQLIGFCRTWPTVRQQQTTGSTPSANAVVIGTHPGCDGPFGACCPSLRTQQMQQGFILPTGLQLDTHSGKAVGELEAEEKSSASGG